MGNTFGKAEISLIFKDTSKTSYKAGEPINLIVKFQSNRVYKDTQIKITFKGSTFTVNKILSIGKWNNKESIHQPHEISFEITSPIDFSPSKDVSLVLCLIHSMTNI